MGNTQTKGNIRISRSGADGGQDSTLDMRVEEAAIADQTPGSDAGAQKERRRRRRKNRRSSSANSRPEGIMDDESMAFDTLRRSSCAGGDDAAVSRRRLSIHLQTMEDSMNESSRRKRVSHREFAASVSQMDPQDVLMQLESIANSGCDNADEYLHSLKMGGTRRNRRV